MTALSYNTTLSYYIQLLNLSSSAVALYSIGSGLLQIRNDIKGFPVKP